MYEAILYIVVAYILHKFAMGYEKNMSFLVVAKFPKV